MGKCKLCNKDKELQESHIVPKFVYRWMKQTGTGRLRQKYRINTPLQDGTKEFLMCWDCEQKFSPHEDWFKRNIFNKFINDGTTIFNPSNSLKYFTISLLWRVLIYFKDDGNKYNFHDKLNEAEKDWRNYLYEDKKLEKYTDFHLMFNPNDIEITNAPKNIYSYLLRGVDFDIVEGDSKCLIYCKFARFIFIGIICGVDSINLLHTDISKTIDTRIQKINDPDISGFIFDRAKNSMSFEDLSKEQQKRNKKYFNKRIDEIKGNDYWNQFLKDNN